MLACNQSSPPSKVEQQKITHRQLQLVKGYCQITKSKQGYENANVGREVQAAIQRGELRYVALGGYGPYVPGIEEFTYKEPNQEEVCWISNVDLCTQAGEPIGVVAVAYAAAYNREMRQRLRKH
jgi:hypothetical protein